MIKISRPLPRNIVLRPRLFEKIDELRKAPAVWVSAPAGSGKTSLISSYIENRHIPCLWYHLDKGDADIGSFFYYVGQAAVKATPRRRLPLPLFTPEYHYGIPAFSRRYFECLYDRFKVPFLLVFDDYQEVPLESSLHEIINTALSCLPEGMNAIVMSRNEPPPLFIRMQANGSLDLLRWDQIRLTEHEALDMIVQRNKEHFSLPMMHHLYQLSDGWAAGLVLMSQFVKREKIDLHQIENCSQEEVFAYFAREVFDTLDFDIREFLIKTSFFQKMTVRMAAELTSHPAAADILNTMVRDNYFIVKNTESTYEYHPLYRDFLQSLAPRILQVEAMPALHKHVASILEQAGQIEAALVLLKKLEDWRSISHVLHIHAPDMLKQGRHRTLQEWFSFLPDEAIESDPWLLYWKGMSFLTLNPRDAQTCFEHAFLLFQAENQPIGALLSASGVTNAIVVGQESFLPLDQWFFVLNDLVKEMGTFPNDEIEAWVTASMITALGVRETPHPDAGSWVQRALTLKETHETVNPIIFTLSQLFWYQGVNRGMNGLFPLLQRLQHLARSPGASPHAQLVVKFTETQYYEEAGRYPECLKAADDALAFSEKHGIPVFDTAFRCMAIASCLNRMDCKTAFERLEVLRPFLGTTKGGESAAIHHQFARDALIRDDIEQAHYYAQQGFRFGSPMGSPFIAGCGHWMMAQVLHRLDRKQGALDHLAHCFAIVDQFGTRWVAVMAHLSDAQFAFDRGDESHGLQALHICLETARKWGYLITCLDDPTVTVRMCEKALEAGIEVEHVQKIIRTRGLIPKKPPVHIENWPWPVRIYTLGRFSIVQDDKPVQPGKKAQQMPLRLLKVLIALGGRDIAEERIADLLWPDAEGDMAHHAFETTLLRLRKLLGYPEALRFRDGKLSLDNRFCWVDIWAFERLLGQAEELSAHNKFDSALHALEKAVRLYHGLFLVGEGHEPWIESTAERLKQKFVRGAMQLGRYLESKGCWGEAVALYEHCLDIDENNEDLFRNLMICHKNLGNSSTAMSVYLRCQKVLSSQLGVAPSAETETVRASLS